MYWQWVQNCADVCENLHCVFYCVVGVNLHLATIRFKCVWLDWCETDGGSERWLGSEDSCQRVCGGDESRRHRPQLGLTGHRHHWQRVGTGPHLARWGGERGGGGGREPREGEWNSIRTVELTLILLDARRKIIVLYGLQCLISMAETQLTSDPHQPVNWVKSHLLI